MVRYSGDMEKRSGQAHPTDLSDAEYAIIEPLIPVMTSKRGRPRSWSLREILNAIFYVLRSGRKWRLMPHDLPPWQTVYRYYWQWRNDGTWEAIDTALMLQVRLQARREPQPNWGEH